MLGGQLAKEGEPFDVVLPDGGRLEVRCVSSFVSFAPSRSRGSGRSVGEGDLATKLREIDGYVICDIQQFPHLSCWLLPSSLIEQWLRDGTLGRSGRMARAKFVANVERLDACGAEDFPYGWAESSIDRSLEWIIAVAVEDPLQSPPYEYVVAVPTVQSVAPQFADMRALTLESFDRVSGGERRRRAAEAGTAVLTTLMANPSFAMPREFPPDAVQVLRLERLSPNGREIVVEIGTDRDIHALVAAFIAAPPERKLDVGLALASLVSEGFVLTSSELGQMLGYSLSEP